MMTSELIPYYFCAECAKLCPSETKNRGGLYCMVCGLLMEPSFRGRRVLFDAEEAGFRHLYYPKDSI